MNEHDMTKIDSILVTGFRCLHADPDSEFSDFAMKNSKRNACILMNFENYLFLFIQFFISYHKNIFYKVSNGSVEVDFRL